MPDETSSNAATATATAEEQAQAQADLAASQAAYTAQQQGGGSEPQIDTSGMDSISSYIPQPKSGTFLCQIIGYSPDFDREDPSKLAGQRITLAAAEPIPDDMGGTIEVGARIGAFRIWTVGDQYRDTARINREWLGRVQALNNIVRDRKVDPRGDAADAAAKALPPIKKCPLPLDVDQGRYDQWVKDYVLVKLTNAPGKDGNSNVNLNAIMAKDTPRTAAK